MSKILPRANIRYEIEPDRKAKLSLWQDRADELQIGEELRRQHKEEETKTTNEIISRAKRTLDTLGNLENDNLKYTNLRSRMNTITRADLELKNMPSEMLLLDPMYKEYFVKETYDEELNQLRRQGKADVMAKCFMQMPHVLTVMKNRVFHKEKSDNVYGHVLDEFYRPLHNPLSTQRLNLHQIQKSKKGRIHRGEENYLGDRTTGTRQSLTKATNLKELFMTSTANETKTSSVKPSYFKIRHKLANLVKSNRQKSIKLPDSDYSNSRQYMTGQSANISMKKAETTRGLLGNATPYDRFLKSVL